MCYRFQQDWPNKLDEVESKGFEELIGRLFGIEDPLPFVKASNIAPTDMAVVVPNLVPRQTGLYRFFIIPKFSDKRNYYDLTLGNARDDTVATSKIWAESFRQRRCVVPVSGFYDFLHTGPKKTDPKIPYVFYVKDEPMFNLAGIWDTWRDPANGEVLHCFAIITVAPNELVAPIHTRMPAILEPEAIETWIQPGEVEVNKLKSLLRPYPAEKMARREFAREVNNPKTKEEAKLKPIGEPETIGG